MGNTRLPYADLNGNGIIETPSEILDEVHYYPNGLKMEGYWMNSANFRYTFNSIEEIDDFGLNVNRATFRTLDPELGRWWSVDPEAGNLMGMSPYNSMNASPLMYSDPDGDFGILAAIGIGAGISVLTNGIQNTKQNNGFFQGAGKAAIKGGVSGAFSYGIGQGFGATGSFINELGRAGAHGLSGGLFSTLEGGSFGSGFLSGAISSGVGSSIAAAGGGTLEQIIGGGFSGGIGSVLGGGKFLDGFGSGLGVGLLNHAVHSLLARGGPPWEYNGKLYDTKEGLLMAIFVDESFEQFGIKDIAAVTGIALGAPTIKKRFTTPGAGDKTSVLSKALGNKLGRSPIKLPTLTTKGLKFTTSIGRFTARTIPFIGWGILAYDSYHIYRNTSRVYNNIISN